MLVTEELFAGGNGEVVRATDRGYKPGNEEFTVPDGRTLFRRRDEEPRVVSSAKILPLKTTGASEPLEPK